uniref:XamI family restriction endonuclease n=1 Tax=Candidatus Desulfatibia profunda TaxID=2841695 RepID=A0A8J6TMU7_9BACT|nr:XamI family restriction endonuclease [Candidatus Desulfatibia profunda]
MPVNADKPHRWKKDVQNSVDFYNNWFLNFAPKAFRKTRIKTTQKVKDALQSTSNLTDIKPEVLKANPQVLQILRMSTCPPIARDRLIGLSGVSPNLVKTIKGEFPFLIEAKSAGDFTNVNKRRKEEAIKMQQLRSTYGRSIKYVLFLCGYFDSGYLGYEAAEGIDWVWEHRIDDLKQFGL